MDIPVLIEPDYRESGWCLKTLEGLDREARRKKYRPVDVQNIGLPKSGDSSRRAAIVLGTSLSWIPKTIQTLSAQGIHPILVNAEPTTDLYPCSTVGMDYAGAMRQLMRYFILNGRKRIALYGFNPNSSADQRKIALFNTITAAEHPEKHVFENHAALGDCFERFFPHCADYDALICANDLVALSAIRHLSARGVNVPGDLHIAGFGESILSSTIHPTLTLSTLDHSEMGRQALLLYSLLTRQSDGISANVFVQSHLVVGESTDCLPIPDASPDEQDKSEPLDFYSDGEVRRLLTLEKLYRSCDELDTAIIRRLRDGETLENIAEHCAASISTIGYRLRRMMQMTGTDSREALFNVLNPNEKR